MTQISIASSALKIAFDQQVFLLQKYGGVSRYICSLAEAMSKMPDANVRLVAPLHLNFPLKELAGVGGSRRWLPSVHPKLFRAVNAASKYLARRELRHFRPDIVHETYFTTGDFRAGGAKRVVTVYDMIHERFADRFDQAHRTSEAKRAAVERADHVICISENTRRDLIDLWGITPAKLSVTYLAADDVFRGGQPEARSASSKRPFLLFVGSRGGYKNFDGLLRAVANGLGVDAGADIVCFGGGELTGVELDLIGKLGFRKDQVRQEGGGDVALRRLYGSALALVYPSLYEGFGIPPLEAMAADCPVVTSNSSSLPEVVGDAGEYFDPADEDAMGSAIRKVVESTERRAELVALGRARQAMFSWDKCARETLDIYRSLL